MNFESIKKSMINLYEETYKVRLHKKSYDDQVARLKGEYDFLLGLIKDALEEEEDNLLTIANIIPDYVVGLTKSITSKRKISLYVIDHSLNMVAYFVPIMGLIVSDKTEEFCETMVTIWNEKVPESSISLSTKERISGGFRKGLCYITTAVCKSLDKSDDCYELNLLRDYRDDYLLSFPEGKAVVEEYYDVAPTLVNRINRHSDAKGIYWGIWENYIQPCVSFIQADQKEACKELYFQMVRKLEEEYL